MNAVQTMVAVTPVTWRTVTTYRAPISVHVQPDMNCTRRTAQAISTSETLVMCTHAETSHNITSTTPVSVSTPDYTVFQMFRSSCGRPDSVMDSHTTGPRFKTRWVRYNLYRASNWPPPYQHYEVECSPVCVERRGNISWSGLTQYIRIGGCVFQCDVPQQWIAQRQVGP